MEKREKVYGHTIIEGEGEKGGKVRKWESVFINLGKEGGGKQVKEHLHYVI